MSRKSPVQHVDVDLDELRRRLAAAPLSDEDKALFGAVLDTFALMTQALDAKRVSIEHLGWRPRPGMA